MTRQLLNRPLGLWGLILLGCGSEVVHVPPLAFPAGSQALILATEDGEVLELVAYRLSPGQTLALAPVERYVGRYPIRLSAFFYAASLEALGLSEGAVPLVEEGQALSLAFGAQRAEVRGPAVQDWAPITVLDPPLSGLRFPAPDPAVCLDAGGCYTEESGQLGPCQTPCPTPTTLLPRPRPPRPSWGPAAMVGARSPPQTDRGPANLGPRSADRAARRAKPTSPGPPVVARSGRLVKATT